MLTLSASYAYYTDLETSASNTFTGGTLNLQIYNPWTTPEGSWLDGGLPSMTDLDAAYPNAIYEMNAANVKPGDVGKIQLNVKNAGTVDGIADIHFYVTACDENGVIEPEPTDDPEGDLCENMWIEVWYGPEDDGDGGWQEPDGDDVKVLEGFLKSQEFSQLCASYGITPYTGAPAATTYASAGGFSSGGATGFHAGRKVNFIIWGDDSASDRAGGRVSGRTDTNIFVLNIQLFMNNLVKITFLDTKKVDCPCIYFR